MPVVLQAEDSHSPTASIRIEIWAIRGILKNSSRIELECGTTPAGRRRSSSSRREVFDRPLSGQSVYEQTSGVLRHTESVRGRVRDDPGMRARSRRTIWNRARLRRTVCDRARHGLAGSTGTKKVSQKVPNFTVSLGSSQGTNPRTGGHCSRKCLLKFWDFGRCSCRNFGTCIITLMLSSGPVRRDGLFWDFGSLYQGQVPHVAMGRSQFCTL